MVSKKKAKVDAAIIQQKGICISIRNLTFVNHADTVSPFPSATIQRPFILESVGTRICFRLARMLAARSDIPMTKEKFPDAEQASPKLSVHCSWSSAIIIIHDIF